MLGEIKSTPDKWLCNNCNCTGLISKGSPEDYEEEVQEMELKENEQSSIDTDLGKAYLKYVIYISIPLTILYIIANLL